ncbi:hypothetical protein IFM89_021196 [Coptis chinensis]|uniref:Phosphoribosyltransferase domain-containing protein n=1 Tax=Coptis chinensis TaxID=261450 RepID=A0A835HFZ1_9MAGN|nr:hypothetical protein IFM89_021196 [Coptis chinensis]
MIYMLCGERFYFGDHVLPCFEIGIPLLKQCLHQLPDADNISIAFPDDGAWKRFYKQLQHFPMVVCTKVREGDKRFVRLKEGSAAGRHVVIVDDLVQSGGTIECQKVLAAHGATKVSAYVTHGLKISIIIEGGRDEEGDLEGESAASPSSPSSTVMDVVSKDEGLIVFFLVLEEIRLGLELNDYSFQQRRIAHMRFLGELYNYDHIDSSVIFETLYLILAFGHGTSEV